MSNPLFEVTPSMVALSSATEAGVSAAQGASAGTASAALVGILEMAGDVTSIAFANALRAAGAAYVGAIAEHTAQRGMFAGAQGIAGATFEAVEVGQQAALALRTAL